MIDLTAADMRRAAALIAHHGSNNPAGIAEVITQADAEQRIAELLFAVLDVYAELVPLLHSPQGLGLFRAVIGRMAVRELDDESPE